MLSASVFFLPMKTGDNRVLPMAWRKEGQRTEQGAVFMPEEQCSRQQRQEAECMEGLLWAGIVPSISQLLASSDNVAVMLLRVKAVSSPGHSLPFCLCLGGGTSTDRVIWAFWGYWGPSEARKREVGHFLPVTQLCVPQQ